MDVAFTSIEPAGVSVLFGNGDGTFQPAQFYVAGELLWSLEAGDFNGDGLPHIVLSDRTFGAITLLNTGVAAFSPTSPLVFSAQLIGAKSAPRMVALKNNGTISLTIRSIHASGEFQVSDTCGSSVPAGATCKVSVVFEPKSAGIHTGQIAFVDAASDKPQLIELSGSGTVAKVSPSTLDFASQKIGSKSAPQSVAVTNKGSTSISFESINLAGANAGDFSESNSCTGRSLPPGNACAVNVVFMPKKAGVRTALLYLNLQGTVSPQPVTLSGTGN